MIKFGEKKMEKRIPGNPLCFVSFTIEKTFPTVPCQMEERENFQQESGAGCGVGNIQLCKE